MKIVDKVKGCFTEKRVIAGATAAGVVGGPAAAVTAVGLTANLAGGAAIMKTLAVAGSVVVVGGAALGAMAGAVLIRASKKLRKSAEPD